MATQIHTELKSIAGSNPAAYLSVKFVQMLTIQTTLISIKKITGVPIPVGKQVLAARLESANFTQDPLQTSRLTKLQNALPNQIGLTLNADLTAKITIFIAGDPTKVVSTVTVTITGMLIRGSYATNTLFFEGLDFKSTTAIARTQGAGTMLQNAGIDPLEAARVEGLIAYSVVNNAISTSLSQRKEFSLSQLFPAFDFGTDAQLEPLVSGTFLGIIPNSSTLNQNAACTCAVGPDVGVSKSSSTITIPPNPTRGTPIGTVQVGGPIPQHINPLRDLGKRYEGSGDAGVYLPQSTYDGMTIQVMPAISIHASDDGFLGFDAYATVSFSSFSASLDAVNGGVIVSVTMNLIVQAICYCNLGCGVQLPVGTAIIQPSGGPASLQMGFYPSVDDTGTVKLKAVLLNVDMGQYIAIVNSTGSGLSLIGVDAWTGFLIDVILSLIVSIKLPAALKSEVTKYLGQNEWTLLNFGDLYHQTFTGVIGYAAPFDVDTNTMLASIQLDR
jgi:hypothetical protein